VRSPLTLLATRYDLLREPSRILRRGERVLLRLGVHVRLRLLADLRLDLDLDADLDRDADSDLDLVRDRLVLDREFRAML
jgi:hypothetical protein